MNHLTFSPVVRAFIFGLRAVLTWERDTLEGMVFLFSIIYFYFFNNSAKAQDTQIARSEYIVHPQRWEKKDVISDVIQTS